MKQASRGHIIRYMDTDSLWVRTWSPGEPIYTVSLHDDGSFLDAESLSLEDTDELDEQGRAGLQRLSELAWSETESGQADRASIDRGEMTASRRMELAGRIEELVAHYKVSYYM
jgi:hypothetical protein